MQSAFFRPLVLAVTLACLVLTGSARSNSRRPSSPQNSNLVAHEWGTFTSIAGADGRAVEWIPLSGKYDLPAFVEHFRTAETKGALRGTVRMETPVLYFYAPVETTVSVKVSFARGVITEWYPHASRTTPDAKVILRDAALIDGHADGSIAWDHVTVEPGTSSEFLSDKDQPEGHYYAAREAQAAPLTVKAPGGAQHEKFLFYRGVSDFSVPVATEVMVSGKVVVRNPEREEIPQMILFERRGDKLGYRLGGAANGDVYLDPPEMTATVESLSYELEDVLTAQGLYPDEAHAMVETWQGSWFEEGSRLFYIVPKKFLNQILPLSVRPAPQQTVRVFVGRMEIVTSATEHAVETALAKRDPTVISTYGRFLPSILDVMKTRNPMKAAGFDEDMSQIYSLPSPAGK